MRRLLSEQIQDEVRRAQERINPVRHGKVVFVRSGGRLQARCGGLGSASLVGGGREMTVFEYLAYTAPEVLLALQAMGLLCVEDYLPAGVAVLMRHAAWKRVRGRLRQTRVA